jgi:hypothetical protein
MNDFLGLMQGDKRRQNQVHCILFKSIDSIFCPLDSSDPSTRQEPISVKKLLKGNGAWETTKTMLGWVINSIAETLQLPPCRLLRLVAILDKLPRSKTRIATKRWQQIIGKLRSMVLAIPGLRGLFSLFQETLRHESQRQIRLTPSMHDSSTTSAGSSVTCTPVPPNSAKSSTPNPEPLAPLMLPHLAWEASSLFLPPLALFFPSSGEPLFLLPSSKTRSALPTPPALSPTPI